MKQQFINFISNPNFKSFAHTFLTNLLYDLAVGAAFGALIFDGNFSSQALYSLGYAVFRTLLRSVRDFSLKKLNNE